MMGTIEVKPTGLEDYWGRPIYISICKEHMFVDTNLGSTPTNVDLHWVDRRPLTFRFLNNPEAFEPTCRVEQPIKIIKEVKSG